MASPVEVIPDPGFPAAPSSVEAFYLSDAAEDAISIGQQINERRARAENPEALRLARAL